MYTRTPPTVTSSSLEKHSIRGGVEISPTCRIYGSSFIKQALPGKVGEVGC